MSREPDIMLCFRCMTWHMPPKYSWDCDATCVKCGKRVGYPAAQQPRDGRCSKCWLKDEGLVA